MVGVWTQIASIYKSFYMDTIFLSDNANNDTKLEEIIVK